VVEKSAIEAQAINEANVDQGVPVCPHEAMGQ
jgi:hypothetical protein